MKKRLTALLLASMLLLAVAACTAKDMQQNEERIDIDLSGLSNTLVFAELQNIYASPQDYIGQTIKINGPYFASYYAETGMYYHYVLIVDAAACCQAGVEFVWKGEHAYPADYPDAQAMIEVSGVFKSYEELGQTFYHLEVEGIQIITDPL
ncbi:MAG: hypothetical protein FWF10_03670 [Clostridiales bacterium]|nr:hypothetical protein [Clostridiales bacterium]